MITRDCTKFYEIFRMYHEMPENGAWGNLHIVLDDGNIRDDDINFCISKAIEEKDYLGAALGYLLLSMTKTQRLKVRANS